VLVGLLAAVAVVFARTRSIIVEDDRAVSSTVDADGEFDPIANADLEFAGTSRPNYKYSVIPGGAYDEFELRAAVQNDPVVAAHYGQLDQSKLRVETVPRDRYVYVSYRKGNEIFWTKKKVLLRQGETILTDGNVEVRGRCGNCISEQPLLPTADNEPEIVEFDRLTDSAAMPRGGTSGETALVPIAPVAAASSGPGVDGAAPAAGSPDPLAAGRASAGAAPVPLAGGKPVGGAPTPSPDPPPVETPAPGRGNDPSSDPAPGIDLPPFVGTPDFPGFDGPLTGDDLFPNPPGGPTIPPGMENPIPPLRGNPELPPPGITELPPPGSPGAPINPVPVPEPGTLVLVGGGIAALIRKLRSRAS
jgi:hypothetical protein